MKTASLLFFLLSILLFAFGYWGYFTFSGRTRFDEMSGMIPFFSLVGSGFCVAICITLVIIQRFRK
jgi:hypothetical protein